MARLVYTKKFDFSLTKDGEFKKSDIKIFKYS